MTFQNGESFLLLQQAFFERLGQDFLKSNIFLFPLRSNFLQAPLESGLFYRNILCGEKCCLTATADWIGRLGRGIGGGLPQMGGSPFYFLRWEGHISTFSGGRVTFFLSKVGKWPLYFPRWEGYLFMRRLETLPLTFAFVSTNITVRWTSLKMRLNNKIFIHN